MKIKNNIIPFSTIHSSQQDSVPTICAIILYEEDSFPNIFLLSIKIHNCLGKKIKRIDGHIEIQDKQGKSLFKMFFDLNSKIINIEEMIKMEELSLLTKRFLEEENTFKKQDYNDFIYKYNVSTIVFEDNSIERWDC